MKETLCGVNPVVSAQPLLNEPEGVTRVSCLFCRTVILGMTTMRIYWYDFRDLLLVTCFLKVTPAPSQQRSQSGREVVSDCDNPSTCVPPFRALGNCKLP